MLKLNSAEWRNAEPPSGSTCVDAETLAAWAEGALTPAESALVETHLADCARCQEMAALFATSEPAAATAPATILPWPRRYWMPIAGAAIAASVLIAVAVRSQDRTPAVTAEIASGPAGLKPGGSTGVVTEPPTIEAVPSRQQKPAGSAGAPRSAPKFTPPPPATGADRTQTMAATTPTPAAIAPQAQAGAAVAPPPPAPAPLVIAPKAEAVLPLPAGPPPQPQARPTPPPPPPVMPPSQAVTVSAAPPVADRARLSANTSAAVGVTATELMIRAEPIAEFAAPKRLADAAAGGRGGGGGRGGAAPSALSIAVNGGSNLRWRVRTPTRVERSIDDGLTWVAVDLGTDTVAITNGVAPAPLTCWLVGRAGVVYRSVDGVTFVRIAFPETIDLVAIVSTNAASATVTAVGGRQFATTDAGRTWSEIK